jgi:mRNA interferase MazF
MKRGEIWTVAGGASYAGKPRPAVIIQDDAFDANDSIVVCPLTTDPIQALPFRIPVQPTEMNGLRIPCSLMLDKLAAVPRVRLRQHVGILEDRELSYLSRAIVVFLGLAGATGR